MDLATRWSNLFVGMSPASFFNFSFLPKYGVYFLQALGYTLLVPEDFTIGGMPLALLPLIAAADFALGVITCMVIRKIPGVRILFGL